MCKIGIIIPVRDCLELTKDAIATIATIHEFKIYVVDDHSGPEMKAWLSSRSDIVTFTDLPGSTGLSYNWNYAIREAEKDGCDHFLIMNNDVVLHPKTIDNLVSSIDNSSHVLVSASNINRGQDPHEILNQEITTVGEEPHPDFSCFMITPRTILEIGWFDQNFIGAYFEDNDYHARIILSGHTAIKNLSAPYFHYGAKTMNTVSASEKAIIDENFINNAEYFKLKWGNYRISEPRDFASTYYPTPFNDLSKTVKEW